jgi:hypothetical protein
MHQAMQLLNKTLHSSHGVVWLLHGAVGQRHVSRSWWLLQALHARGGLQSPNKHQHLQRT